MYIAISNSITSSSQMNGAAASGGGGGFTNTYSLAFDGVDDKIQFESIALGSDYTLSAWAKRLSTANMFLFGNSQTYGYGAYFNGTSNLYFKETNSDLITFNNTAIQTALARTDWVNWVFKKDSTAGTVSVYVDGVLAESTSSVKGMSTITTIGGSGLSSGTQYIWNGNIDEVAIFNTSSVSLDDLGSSTTPKDLSSISGLTAWYRNGDNGSYKSPQWLIPENSNKDKVSNYSFDFDGVDDSINCGDSDTFSFGNGSTDSPFSISAWIKPSSMGTTFHILNKENNTTTGDEYVFYITNTNILRFAVCDQNFIADRQGRITSALTASEIDNVWCHVVATYDGRGGSTASDGINIYVNGVNRTSGTFNAGSYTAMHNTTSDVKIGSYSSGVFANGNIDDTAIFNSELTSENVTSLYGGGTPTTLPVTPIAHWKMGEEANFTDNWLVNNSALSNYSTRSFNFDGVDDFINCGNITALNNAPNASWSFWMNPSATALRYLFSAYQGSGSNQQIYFAKKGTGIAIRLRGQGYVGGTPVMFNESSQSWTLGSWYHIVVTFDGAESDNAQKVKVYVNGSALTNTSSGAAFTNLNTTTSDFHIASFNSSNEFAGNIDEFSIYDYTLTQANVNTIFNSGVPNNLANLTTPPIHWWRMGDGDTFPTLTDNSGSNNGTMTNMTSGDIVEDVPS